MNKKRKGKNRHETTMKDVTMKRYAEEYERFAKHVLANNAAV
jgi:hypothetical protein